MSLGHTKLNRTASHHVRRTSNNLRQAMVSDAALGGITLVLGAGVSLSRGLRGWHALARGMWGRVLPEQPMPAWLEGDGVPPHPLAYGMVFEELEHLLRGAASVPGTDAANGEDPIAEASERFARLLTDELYENVKAAADPADTLSVIAEVVRQEQASKSPRIVRVITLNADDLLETACNVASSAERAPVVWPIARASYHPRRDPCANGRPPIPVYHVHGFLPRTASARAAPETLVFTDAQYWRSVASPATFANRTLVGALQDSHCIFIGMSMQDVNLMRWLGLRQVEVEDDYRLRHGSSSTSPAKYLERIRETSNRHFWVTISAADPTRIIASHLERRGVGTVLIESWGTPFAEIMRDCFPP